MSGISDPFLNSHPSDIESTTSIERQPSGGQTNADACGFVKGWSAFLLDRRKLALVVLLSLLFGFQGGLFWPVTVEFFTPDAVFYLARQVNGWDDIKDIFTSLDDVANYRPLTYLVATGFHSFWKLDPFPYHVFAVLAHIGITGLVFWLARLLLTSEVAAFATAAFFGVHSAASRVAFGITFISDLLYAAFFILAIIAFIKFELTGRKHWMALSLSCFILSLLSKEPAVTLPAVLTATLVFVSKTSMRIGSRSITWSESMKRAAPFWAIGLVYLSWFAFLSDGWFVPQNPAHPYYVSLSWESITSKVQYLGLALNLGRFSTMGVHPTVAKVATGILPSSLAENFMQTSDFWLYLMGPVWIIWLGIKGNWQELRTVAVYAISTPLLVMCGLVLLRSLVRRKRVVDFKMMVYGLLFFLLPLSPVLILPADKTMLHNLYVPAVGLGIVLGSLLRIRWHQEIGPVTRLVGVGFLAMVIAVGIHYVPTSIQNGWPTTTSRAANKYLKDVQRFQPNLPKGAVLYFDRTGMPGWPFLTAGGDLFRVFYGDQTLVTMFGDFGEEIPESAYSDGRLFRFREANGSLIPYDN